MKNFESVYKFSLLFDKINQLLHQNDRLIIAVDGRSAAGKTTLSQQLSKIYGCTVFHMDDFFLRPEQRTDDRYREVGGNIDYERFLSEVLIPLKNLDAINYRRFDCSTMQLSEPICIIPEKLTVIEGAYSMHPLFREYYDFSVFLDISSDLQKQRILSRNTPQQADNFFNKWIPLEDVYFLKEDIKNKCDFIIDQTH